MDQTGNIPMDIKVALAPLSVKMTEVCLYAEKAHKIKYSNVYIQAKIDLYPDKRDPKVEVIIAEFLCILDYISDTYGIRNVKRYLKDTLDSFPKPSPELKNYIAQNVKKVYESLWGTAYPEGTIISSQSKTSRTGKKK